jgi:hypothetical protein
MKEAMHVGLLRAIYQLKQWGWTCLENLAWHDE